MPPKGWRKAVNGNGVHHDVGSAPTASLSDLDILDSSTDAVIAVAKAKQTPGLGDRRVALNDYRVEVGSTGLNIFGGRLQQEFLMELQGMKGYRVYEEMRKNDPVIGGLLFATEQAIRRVNWYSEGIDTTDEHKRASDFLDEARHDMSHSWNDFISEALTFLPFGWALFETCYKERLGRFADPPSKYEDGKIGWRKFGYRPPDTLERWEMDEHGGIKGMWQRDIRRPMAPVFIPIEKSVLFRTKRERNNPEGISVLRTSYKPYFFKKEMEKFEAIALERTGAGIPVIKLPLGYTQRDLQLAKQVVRRIRVDEQMGVTLPPGWELELLRPAGRAETQTYEVAINRYSNHMLMSLLLTFIALGTNNVGSFALVRAQQDFFRLALVGWVNNMSETFNQFAVRPLFELNAGAFSEDIVSDPPKICTTDIGEYDLETIAKFIQMTGNAGFLTPDDRSENYLRRIAGLPTLDEETDAEEREALRQAIMGAKNPELSDTELAEKDKEREDRRDMQAKQIAAAGTINRPYGNPNAAAKPSNGAKPKAATVKKARDTDIELRKRYREMSYGRRPIDGDNIMQMRQMIEEVIQEFNKDDRQRQDDYDDDSDE